MVYLPIVLIGELLLCHCDILSKTLQSKDISAAEAQQIVLMTLKKLVDMKTVEKFSVFWISADKLAEYFGVNDPQLPRKKWYQKDLEGTNRFLLTLQQWMTIIERYFIKH